MVVVVDRDGGGHVYKGGKRVEEAYQWCSCNDIISHGHEPGDGGAPFPSADGSAVAGRG